MKKLSAFTILLLVTNAFTICILIWCCFFRCPQPCSNFVAKKITKGPNLACPSCCPDDNCYNNNCDITDPFPLDFAVSMIHNYRVNHWEAINKYCGSIVDPSFYNLNETLYNANKIDARSAWFDLETLKKFIHTIESNTCKNLPAGCSTPVLGIRIYYAEYPTTNNGTPPCVAGFNQITPQIDKDYAGLHTLLMIPTFDRAVGLHVDFDPSKITNCPLNSVFDSLAIVPPGSTITALAAQNHGGLAPPPFYASGGYWATGAYFMQFVDMFKDGYLSPTTNSFLCPAGNIIGTEPPIGRP